MDETTRTRLEQIGTDLEWRGVAPLKPRPGGENLSTAIHGRNGWIRLTVRPADGCSVQIAELTRSGGTGWTIELDPNVPHAVLTATITAALGA